jgi:hypothetical protein
MMAAATGVLEKEYGTFLGWDTRMTNLHLFVQARLDYNGNSLSVKHWMESLP